MTPLVHFYILLKVKNKKKSIMNPKIAEVVKVQEMKAAANQK